MNNNCECAAIKDCMDCPTDSKCFRCKEGKLLNEDASPNTCVDKCPDKTYKLDNKCISSCPVKFKVLNGTCVKKTEYI